MHQFKSSMKANRWQQNGSSVALIRQFLRYIQRPSPKKVAEFHGFKFLK